MRPILEIILIVLDIYWWVVIATVIFTWLYAFGIVNTRNQVVGMIWNFLYQVTEPVLRPIRRIIPPFGTVDVSPVILLLLIYLIQRVIVLYVYPNVI